MENPVEVQLVEYDDGFLRDSLIEELLGHIIQENWATPNFDAVFTRVVREHINEDSPHLVASFAGKDQVGASAFNYLALFQMDFDVIFPSSGSWPGFSWMPKATCAVRVSYADGSEMTDWCPGNSINQAVLGSMIQYCREVSLAYYNQHHLDFGVPERKEVPNAD